ncbi:MAG: hypothetical protein MI924_06500 [Chloroflexales bacterium]|nr:hypothetical protein [Chloroflexales bacterium]
MPEGGRCSPQRAAPRLLLSPPPRLPVGLIRSASIPSLELALDWTFEDITTSIFSHC